MEIYVELKRIHWGTISCDIRGNDFVIPLIHILIFVPSLPWLEINNSWEVKIKIEAGFKGIVWVRRSQDNDFGLLGIQVAMILLQINEAADHSIVIQV